MHWKTETERVDFAEKLPLVSFFFTVTLTTAGLSVFKRTKGKRLQLLVTLSEAGHEAVSISAGRGSAVYSR